MIMAMIIFKCLRQINIAETIFQRLIRVLGVMISDQKDKIQQSYIRSPPHMASVNSRSFLISLSQRGTMIEQFFI